MTSCKSAGGLGQVFPVIKYYKILKDSIQEYYLVRSQLTLTSYQ